jgi:hypothetical protein
MRNPLLLPMCLIVAGVCRAADPTPKTDLATVAPGDAGRAVFLSIDDQSLPLRDNLCYYISKPLVRDEAVIKPVRDNPHAPDQLAAFFYGTVINDGGKYRMWYYGARRAGGRWKLASVPCYAESADGIHWHKPALQQVDIGGSLQNNALAVVDGDTQGVTVLKDPADPSPTRRYKMVLQYMPRDYPTLKTAMSADGLKWTAGSDLPQRQFREQASFFKHNGIFVVCGHSLSKGESGSSRGRQGFAWISPDFERWPIEEAESFLLPEPPAINRDKWKQPFDQVHLGVGATSFGNVAVGLYGLWHEHGWGEGGTSCDLGLVVSNDGIHFREPVPRHVFMASGEAILPAVGGKKFPTILTQANGILNVGDETRIYYGRWRNSEWPLQGDGGNYYSEIGLATLPRDRWGALGLVPKATEGSVWTAPFRLSDGHDAVALNAEGANGMRVEIADANFRLLPEFSGENAGTCTQPSGLKNVVAWRKGDVRSLAGQTVRLHIQLTKKSIDPKLFAIYVAVLQIPQINE